MTTDPHDVMMDHEREYKQWWARVEEFRASIFRAPLPGVATLLRTVGPTNVFVGFDAPADGAVVAAGAAVGVTTVPTGWRLNARARLIVPNERTKAGRGYAAMMQDLQPPEDPRARMPGMPGYLVLPDVVVTCAVERIGSSMYVRWPCQAHYLEGHVDGEVWAPVRLSEYYAAREDNDQAPD